MGVGADQVVLRARGGFFPYLIKFLAFSVAGSISYVYKGSSVTPRAKFPTQTMMQGIVWTYNQSLGQG
jgi:hypothetical protein